MSEREPQTCVCGKKATEPIPEGVDEVCEVVSDNTKPIFGIRIINYPKLCKQCYERVKTLKQRFKPAFVSGVVSWVSYDRERDLFRIQSFNEYEDKAYLDESMTKTISFIRDLWTSETVVLKDDEVVGVM